MGCVLGSFGFDLTVQDVYEAVLLKLPEAIAKALTDDFTVAIKCPSKPNEQEIIELIRKASLFFITVREEAAERAGLKLNFGKCHVLFPESVAKSLPEGFLSTASAFDITTTANTTTATASVAATATAASTTTNTTAITVTGTTSNTSDIDDDEKERIESNAEDDNERGLWCQ